MSTTSPKSSENVQRLEEALKRAMSGVRDSERMGKALEAAKRSAEETRKQVGILNVCVDLIREVRAQ